ncbi:sodium-dependent transporter [uncultured Methanobrevibacter sp.]|uniref:sodium-dependent transporter n=1 Tax=uncultured Methanobrevibacter sp. TaxID=253161 RepID=UPI0025E217EA|nr:sodium-dependent transporter [uncultured Methanobrevibacter sp.]
MSRENQWGSTLSFILAMIGSAVGLGNIWRYPYVLYSSGGGAFFIPYIIAILLMGIPILFLEYGIGFKFKSSFAKTITQINPKWQFLGWFVPVSLLTVMIYYSSLLSIDGIYIFLSMFKGWGADPNAFFTTTLTHSSTSVSGILNFVPLIGLAIIIVWILVWYISHRDLESGLGKVSKILVPMLFIIMIFMIIFSVTLPGASIGLAELYRPNWSLLSDPNIWMMAFGQIIFSLNIGLSGTITFAGYLNEDTDIISNTIIIALANSLFENISAIAVFSILGYMSLQTATPVGDLVSQGTGLIFIIYPAIFNILGQLSYIIGPLFFLTIFIAGLTSILTMIEPIAFSVQNKFNVSRKYSVTVLCIIGGLISLVYATSFGSTLLEYVDTYVNQIAILFCLILECILFAWMYKAENLLDVLNSRTKSFKLGKGWLFIVKYLLPIGISIVWVGGMIGIIKDYSMERLTITLVVAVIIFVTCLILTRLKPTNPNWDKLS